MHEHDQIISTDDGQPTQPFSRRRQALVDALPAHNWSLKNAALSLGYSESYVSTRLGGQLAKDVGFCRAIERRKREISERTWSVEAWREMVSQALAGCRAHGDRTNEKELLRMIAQHIGAFEADNRQKQPQIGMVIM